jgi:hypothetical protein
MRYAYLASANTGTLDVDVIFYEGITVSADGASELIVSTNDAFVKTTSVLMFKNPTVTDLGNFKALTSMLGTNKSTSSKDTNVPEWILAPDGNDARDYLMRVVNNGAGTADVVPALFFYDTLAVVV